MREDVKKIPLSRIPRKSIMDSNDLINFMIDNGYTVVINDYDAIPKGSDLTYTEYEISDLCQEINNLTIWDRIKSKTEFRIMNI